MRRPIVLRQEAETDLQDAFDYYESQQHGLGLEFETEIQQALNRVGSNPESYQFVLADIRRAHVHRFPYRLFYRSHPDRIEILAILHTSRHPGIWQARG